MAGHNKWSKVKHIKGPADAKRGKIFSKLSKEITLAAKAGGGNPDMNARLRSAILSAKGQNMPNDTIDRAIKKATTDNSADMESIVYESYGPGGVAILIDALTDNRNKAAQEIKHILSKNGFELASPGSASWAFKKENNVWNATTTMPLEDADIETLTKLVEELEENDEVQNVYTNAE